LNQINRINQDRIKIVAVGVFTDGQPDGQYDKSEFIICPMLCYSNRTHNNSDGHSIRVINNRQSAVCSINTN